MKPNAERARDSGGYVQLRPDKREHVDVAERALGKPLPKGAVIHHVNGIRHDNRSANLVICDSPGYHTLLHYRLRALRATGNANAVRCSYCLTWTTRDDPDLRNYSNRRNRFRFWHSACSVSYTRAWKLRTGYKPGKP